ncbi:MAG: hypothetical protein A2145_06080 [candidate division Zixibacteria bacterium RBG_16_40_9]|nr:MAG: hypothetical protein A2145_06080 [candidate division Zixibacteria bacterium RBG_16_40_9]
MSAKKVLLAAVLVSVATSLALAQPDRDRLRIHKELNLSEKQEKQLQDLHFNIAKQMIQVRSQLQLARLDLHRMLAEEEPDRDLIFNQIEQISKIQAEMKKVKIEKRLAFRDILDKKQLDKLRELRQERRPLFLKKRLHRPGKGMGLRAGCNPDCPMWGEPPCPSEMGLAPEPGVPPIPEDEFAPEMGLLFEPFPEFDLIDEPIPLLEELPEIQ